MSEKKHNLSDYNVESIPDAADMSFGIVVSEWNEKITGALSQGAIETLKKHGVLEENIVLKHVPGSFELPLGAQWMFAHYELDAVLCLGCVIQGETRHFDYVCHGVTEGIMRLNLDYSRPVIFGVLTTNTFEQALARAGGHHGNKGVEAALTGIKMVALGRNLAE